MGISLKDIMKPDYDQIAIDRRKQVVKKLIIAAIIIFVLIVATLIFSIIMKIKNDALAERLRLLNADVGNLSTSVLLYGDKYKRGEVTELIGDSLSESPVSITMPNKTVVEYRYGYFSLTPEQANTICTSLNLTDEYYLVNYETGDVVNGGGITINGWSYYAKEDIQAIASDMSRPSDYIIYISKPEDMVYIEQYPDRVFRLSANIDMTGYANGDGWYPIEVFSGVLDGRGYTIKNLKIVRPTTTFCGLFGQITSSGEIRNLTIEDADITGGKYTGVLAGYSSGDIINCNVTNCRVVSQEEAVGGLLGSFDKGTLNGIIVSGVSISGNDSVGGLIGRLYSGDVIECSVSGNLAGVSNVGGLIGNTTPSTSTTIQRACANIYISGRTQLGGVIGGIDMINASTLNLKDIYCKGAVDAGIDQIGGVVGSINAINKAIINMECIYTTVGLTSLASARGGVVGQKNIMEGCSPYAANCIWKRDPLLDSGLSDVGNTLDSFKLSFIAKTADEMKARVTYGTWNFDVWEINERVGTPYFKWEAEQVDWNAGGKDNGK